jgi:hypothetical protein
MDRREFIKQAGLVSLASPSLLGALATPARADEGEISPNFACLSYSTVNPTGEQLIMAGHGTFSPSDAEVTGGGCYNVVNTGAPRPNPLLESGSWQATKLVSWTPIGNYGSTLAGTLVLMVQLSPVGGPAYMATLKVVCNIPFVPFLTGQPEGITLTTPTVTFAPGSDVGQPQVGVTIFCTGGEPGD